VYQGGGGEGGEDGGYVLGFVLLVNVAELC
jgi:hypothetical protein